MIGPIKIEGHTDSVLGVVFAPGLTVEIGSTNTQVGTSALIAFYSTSNEDTSIEGKTPKLVFVFPTVNTIDWFISKLIEAQTGVMIDSKN